MSDENINSVEHFQWGHVGAIALCAIFLVSITVMKNGFSFSENNSVKQYTLSDALSEVEKERGGSLSPENDNGYAEASAKLAEINPTDSSGQVLGASTDFEKEIQNASSLLTPGRLSQIRVSVTNNYDEGYIQRYTDYLNNIELEDGKDFIFANLNSTDVDSLNQATNLSAKIIADISSMTVPAPMEKFHKLKILYYTSLLTIMQIKAGNISTDELSNTATSLFGILDQLGSEQAALNTKYNINLSM